MPNYFRGRQRRRFQYPESSLRDGRWVSWLQVGKQSPKCRVVIKSREEKEDQQKRNGHSG